jgi:hypothetical protein
VLSSCTRYSPFWRGLICWCLVLELLAALGVSEYYILLGAVSEMLASRRGHRIAVILPPVYVLSFVPRATKFASCALILPILPRSSSRDGTCGNSKWKTPSSLLASVSPSSLSSWSMATGGPEWSWVEVVQVRATLDNVRLAMCGAGL